VSLPKILRGAVIDRTQKIKSDADVDRPVPFTLYPFGGYPREAQAHVCYNA
jgi:hypothetical protein